MDELAMTRPSRGRREFAPGSASNRRAESVKTLKRGLGAAFLAASFLGLAGCGADNEAEANRLQGADGASPKTDVAGGEAPAQSKSYEEWSKLRQGQLSQDPRQSNYAKGVGGYKAPSQAKK
jgi:hypothetical protein